MTSDEAAFVDAPHESIDAVEEMIELALKISDVSIPQRKGYPEGLVVESAVAVRGIDDYTNRLAGRCDISVSKTDAQNGEGFVGENACSCGSDAVDVRKAAFAQLDDALLRLADCISRCEAFQLLDINDEVWSVVRFDGDAFRLDAPFKRAFDRLAYFAVEVSKEIAWGTFAKSCDRALSMLVDLGDANLPDAKLFFSSRTLKWCFGRMESALNDSGSAAADAAGEGLASEVKVECLRFDGSPVEAARRRAAPAIEELLAYASDEGFVRCASALGGALAIIRAECTELSHFEETATRRAEVHSDSGQLVNVLLSFMPWLKGGSCGSTVEGDGFGDGCSIALHAAFHLSVSRSCIRLASRLLDDCRLAFRGEGESVTYSDVADKVAGERIRGLFGDLLVAGADELEDARRWGADEFNLITLECDLVDLRYRRRALSGQDHDVEEAVREYALSRSAILVSPLRQVPERCLKASLAGMRLLCIEAAGRDGDWTSGFLAGPPGKPVSIENLVYQVVGYWKLAETAGDADAKLARRRLGSVVEALGEALDHTSSFREGEFEELARALAALGVCSMTAMNLLRCDCKGFAPPDVVAWGCLSDAETRSRIGWRTGLLEELGIVFGEGRFRGVGRWDSDLAYYTSVPNALRILEPTWKEARQSEPVSGAGAWDTAKNCMTIMSASYMNDPSEGTVLVDYLLSGGRAQRELASRLKGRARDRNDVFLKSFTTRLDDIRMWSMYGAESLRAGGDGCCIIVDPATFNEAERFTLNPKLRLFESLRPEENGDFNLYRVAYIEKRGHDGSAEYDLGEISSDAALMNCMRILRRSSILLAQHCEGRLGEVLENALLDCLAPLSFVFKDASYSYEGEVRLVTTRSFEYDECDDVVTVGTADGKLPLYCLKPYRQVFVKGVILGPRVQDPEVAAEHFRYKLKEANAIAARYGQANLPEVRFSEAPYR